MFGVVTQFKENSYKIKILFFLFSRSLKKNAHSQRIKLVFSHKCDRVEFKLT